MTEENESALTVRGPNGELMSPDDVAAALDGTVSKPDSMLDALALFRSGKDDWFNIGKDRVDSVLGIFLMNRRPGRAMWLKDQLTGDVPDCFSLDGIAPSEHAKPWMEGPDGVKTLPAKCNPADCPMDCLGSGQGRGKRCKKKSSDFVLLVGQDAITVTGEIDIRREHVIGPGLIQYSISNADSPKSYEAWKRKVAGDGQRPQGMLTSWAFGRGTSRDGTDYPFVTMSALAKLPGPADAPWLWEMIVSSVVSLKQGGADEILLALSGAMSQD